MITWLPQWLAVVLAYLGLVLVLVVGVELCRDVRHRVRCARNRRRTR